MSLLYIVPIWWGTKHQEEVIGVVADTCPSCEAAKRFYIINHYEVSHVYSIPLGKGTLKATGRRCTSCNNEYNCNPANYDAILSPGEANSISLEELAERTNSELARTMERRARLERIARQDAEPSTGHTDELSKRGTLSKADAQLALAVEKMKRFADREGSAELLAQLEQWPNLDDAQRNVLLRRTEEFTDQASQVDRTVSFITAIAEDFPSNAGCLVGFLVFAAFCSAFIWAPINWNWISGILLFVFSLIVAIFSIHKVSSFRKRNWIAKKLLPLAEQRNIDLEVLVYILASIDPKDKSIKEKVCELAGELEMIRIVIVEQGKGQFSQGLRAT